MKKYVISSLMFVIAAGLLVAAGQITVDPKDGTEAGMKAIGGPPLQNGLAKIGGGGQEDNHYWVCQNGNVEGPKYSGACQTKTSASGCECYPSD
jgi:hypothetical protein